jgi:hypothetical protein
VGRLNNRHHSAVIVALFPLGSSGTFGLQRSYRLGYSIGSEKGSGAVVLKQRLLTPFFIYGPHHRRNIEVSARGRCTTAANPWSPRAKSWFATARPEIERRPSTGKRRGKARGSGRGANCIAVCEDIVQRGSGKWLPSYGVPRSPTYGRPPQRTAHISFRPRLRPLAE